MFDTLLNTARLVRAPDDAASGAATTTPTADAGGTGVVAPQPYVPPWGQDVNKTWMTGDKPWYETTLPDGPTKELFREKRYANPVVAADAYYNANRMVNGNAVEVPAADAKPEVWDAFHTKLGRPPDAEKYEFKMPEGVKPDENLIGFGKKLAFDLGLPPAKAQAMVDKWNEFAIAQNGATGEAEQAANAAELEGVKTKWGDKWDANITTGKRVTQALYDLTKPEEKQVFDKINSVIGNAAMLDLFARIGAKGGEGGMIGGGSMPTDNPDNMTTEQATAEVARLRNDAGFAKQLNDANDPGHQAAIDKMARLYARGVKT